MDTDGATDDSLKQADSSSKKRSREDSEAKGDDHDGDGDGDGDGDDDRKPSPPIGLPPVIGEDGTITYSLSAVHEQFICPLCSGYFREPYTITECLHTFCKSCLFYSSACGCHECPECHSFVSDPMKAATLDNTLQELVDITFPELVKREEQEAIEFYNKRGISLKSKHNKRQRSETAASRATTKTGETGVAGKSSDELDLAVLPERVSESEQLEPLDRPFIRVSGRLKMSQLKRYIVQTLGLNCKLDILCNGVPLGDEISLSFVYRLLWPRESDLELTYKVTSDA